VIRARCAGAAWSMIVRLAAITYVALSGCALPAAPAARGAASSPPIETGEFPIAPDSVASRLLTDARTLDTTIRVELRYATADNFTGAPVPGYQGNRALLRREAAESLALVARDVRADGLALLVFDAYRPVRATQAMMEWTRRAGRSDLVRDGYIASRSRHNLGAAIDLTLVDVGSGMPLDMGTPFDTFSKAAHTATATGTIAANRQRLVRAMARRGFANYEKEWWHYSFPVSDEVRMDLVIR
jgi:D-alanyl-D-alanine dipeptidase